MQKMDEEFINEYRVKKLWGCWMSYRIIKVFEISSDK